MKRFLAVSGLVLTLAALARVATGFSSVAAFVDNHRQITRDAIDELGAAGYPDLKEHRGSHYFQGLVDASATEAAHFDPWTNVETWAEGASRWEGKARMCYEQGEFDEAYVDIGYAVHLAEDDASPVHVYRIYHGCVQLDGFEFFLAPKYWNKVPSKNPGFGNLLDGYRPFTFDDYKELQVRPGFVVSEGDFVAPPMGQRKFWLKDDEDDDDGDDSIHDKGDNSQPDWSGSAGNWVECYQIRNTWGSYGGQYEAHDGVPGLGNENGDWFTQDSVKEVAEKIVLQSLWEGRKNAHRTLVRFSRSLPPLVQGYTVGDGTADPAPIDRARGTPVSFRVHDNRTAEVFVTVSIAGKGPIRDANGEAWSRRKVTLTKQDGPLPWSDDVALSWKGDLADGGSLFGENSSVGTWDLVVSVEDEDGNHTPPGGLSRSLKYRGKDVFSYHIWGVSVANTPPYVRSLRATQGTQVLYAANWQAEGQGRALQGAAEALPVHPGGLPLEVRVEFSQAMTSSPHMTIEGEDVTLVPGPEMDPSIWIGALPQSALAKHARATELQVVIEGTDRQNQELDADPATVPLRDASGAWQGVDRGPDRVHLLKCAPVDGEDLYRFYREYMLRYISDGGRIAERILAKAQAVGVDEQGTAINGEELLAGREGVTNSRRYLQQALDHLDRDWAEAVKGDRKPLDFAARAHSWMMQSCSYICLIQLGECDAETSLNERVQRRESKAIYRDYTQKVAAARQEHFHDDKKFNAAKEALWAEGETREERGRQDAIRRHSVDTRRLLARRRVLCRDVWRIRDFNASASRDDVALRFRNLAYSLWEIDLKARGEKLPTASALDKSVAQTNHAYQCDWVQMHFWFLKGVPNELEMEDAVRQEPVEGLR